MKGTTKSLGKKDKLDRFYTKEDVSENLLQEIDMSNYDLIIEPSAGNGSFSKKIPNCLALDINPQDNSIKKGNFFDIVLPEGNILTIGNPPFGEQGKEAILFFNHAAIFSRTIAFILPRSFKKESVKNKLNEYFHLLKELDIPPFSFIFENQDYDVPCVFQVWERTREKRKKITFPFTSSYIQFVKDKSEADFRVQRVGGKAGQAFLNKDGALSSNYYVKNISNIPTEKMIQTINNLPYLSLEDTVGPKSLPKGELIYLLNEALTNKEN